MISKYVVTLCVRAGEEWYEAAATKDEPFTPEEIDSFVEEIKPILTERGLLKDD